MSKLISQNHFRRSSGRKGFFRPVPVLLGQRDSWIRKFFLALLFCLFSQINTSSLYADDATDREFTIKAGLLLKFTEFIQWPEMYSSISSVEEPVNICIQGEDRFGDLFDYVNDHAIIRRNIFIHRSVSIKQLSKCHILFINDLDAPELEGAGDEIESTPLLVITQTDGNIPPWVAINFRNIDNKIKFEINRAALEHSGLNVSSELLSLAVTVLKVD